MTGDRQLFSLSLPFFKLASSFVLLSSLLLSLLRLAFSILSYISSLPFNTMSATTATAHTKRPVQKRSATQIILPDLVSHCDFKLRRSRYCKQVTSETKKWLFQGDNLIAGKKRDAFHGLKAGLLTSMCYPDAGCPQLRAVNDFLTFLFHLDNLSDDMDNRGTKAIGNAVMNALYHTHSYRSPVRVGRMAAEYV